MVKPEGDASSRRGARLSPAERSTQIIEAAAKLLSSEGLDSVTIAGVAEAAGVTRPVVYRHFFNRDELLAGIAEHLGRRNQEILEQVLESAGPSAEPEDIWRRSVDLYYDVIQELGPATVRALLIPTSKTGRQRIEGWEEWVCEITDVALPYAAGLLHLSVPMLCSYAELWLAGSITREQAVELPVRSILWHMRQFQSAASLHVSPDPKGGDAT